MIEGPGARLALPRSLRPAPPEPAHLELRSDRFRGLAGKHDLNPIEALVLADLNVTDDDGLMLGRGRGALQRFDPRLDAADLGAVVGEVVGRETEAVRKVGLAQLPRVRLSHEALRHEARHGALLPLAGAVVALAGLGEHDRVCALHAVLECLQPIELRSELAHGRRVIRGHGGRVLGAVRGRFQARRGLCGFDAGAHAPIDPLDVATVPPLAVVTHEDRLTHRDHVSDAPRGLVSRLALGADIRGAVPESRGLVLHAFGVVSDHGASNGRSPGLLRGAGRAD